MRRFAFCLATSATLALALPAAAATSVETGPDFGAAPLVLVSQGCGLGFSRGSSGRCIPNSFGFNNGRYGRLGYGRFGYRRCALVRGPYGGLRRICRF